MLGTGIRGYERHRGLSIEFLGKERKLISAASNSNIGLTAISIPVSRLVFHIALDLSKDGDPS